MAIYISILFLVFSLLQKKATHMFDPWYIGMASLSLSHPADMFNGEKKKEMKRKKKRFFKFFLQLGNQSHNMANNKQKHNRIDWDLLKSIIDSLRIVQINCEFVNNLPIIDRQRERMCGVLARDICENPLGAVSGCHGENWEIHMKSIIRQL